MHKEFFIPILVGLALPDFRKTGMYRPRSLLLELTLTEGSNLEDAQGGRKVEPQLVPLSRRVTQYWDGSQMPLESRWAAPT